MTNFCASISSSPLFSSIVTLYALILLYFPYHFLRIVFSPVVIITGILSLTLLRHGAIQRFEIEADEHEEKENDSPLIETEYSETNESNECNEKNRGNRGSTSNQSVVEVQEQIPSFPEDQDGGFFTNQSETDSEREMGFDPNPCFEDSFVQWNLKAPLEVIYEEREGEDEADPNENDPNLNPKQENQVMGLERHPSLSLYYPESDSDSSSDGGFSGTGVWGSPETMCFRWEEDDREGLIEIALDGQTKRGLDFYGDHDDENLIEIDISPTRNNEICREKWQFSGEVRFS